MADLGRYLRRFRRLMSPPGRPGPIAVPSDRTATAVDEIADLLAAVDVIDREAQQVVADAQQDARRRREEARSEAERICAEAQEQAEADRATAATEQRAQLEDELRTLAADADAEADQVQRRAGDRLGSLAGQVATRVLAAVPAAPEGDPGEAA